MARREPADTSFHAAIANVDPARVAALRSLEPEKVGAADVAGILSRFPAPRIVALQGSIALVTMQPLAEFLMAMGYPEERLRNPADGRRTYDSFVDAARLAGHLAWHCEQEAMMPVLIGHSQGGMVVVKVLHELAGHFRDSIPVWDPRREAPEDRTTIVDPVTGVERRVTDLKVGYAAALATGSLPRLILGQWGMLPLLRDIPDSVDAFTGFGIPWDPIAGTGPEPPRYRATGSARVRNVVLPPTTSHIRIPLALHLAENRLTRDWIDRYVPDPSPPLPEGVDAENLLHVADIWWSVKRQWCLDAQRLARATDAADRRQR